MSYNKMIYSLPMACMLAGALLLTTGCGNDKTAKTADTAASKSVETISLTRAQLKTMDIEIAPVEMRMLSVGITANGNVAVLPQNRAAVASKIMGRIESIEVHEGQNVRQGQLLFRISAPAVFDIQQSYLTARADLIFLEKELARQKALEAGHAGAGKNLEEVQSKYFAAKSNLRIAESKLAYLGISTDGLQQADQIKPTMSVQVYAPISGNVTEVPVSLGQSVSDNFTLCHIINSKTHLHAHVEVFSRDAGAMTAGNPVILRFPGSGHSDLHSTIEYISREVNPETRTVSLHVPIPDGTDIIPGMPLVAVLEQKPVQTPTLPESAIVKEGDTSFGFVVESETGDQVVFRRVMLSPGATAGGFVALSAAIQPGTRFAVKGAYIVAGEMKKGEMQE